MSLAERGIEDLVKRCLAPPTGDDARAAAVAVSGTCASISPRPPQTDAAAVSSSSSPPSSASSQPTTPSDDDPTTAVPSAAGAPLERLRQRAETELAAELAKHVLLPVEPVRRLALRLLTQLAGERHAWLQEMFASHIKSALDFVPPKKATHLLLFPLANQLAIFVCLCLLHLQFFSFVSDSIVSLCIYSYFRSGLLSGSNS